MKTGPLLIWIALALGVISLGCRTTDQKAGGEKPAGAGAQNSEVKKESAAHAPVHAKPGSYEDWCDEHKVPESLCTQCNPSLVAAFKATGDWCAEHGLPESQCRICNPELKIERPPKLSEGS